MVKALQIHWKWVVLAFFLAVAVRVYNLNVPFVERFNAISRLSNCGSVARNFYYHGFNFFYPEIDENGPGPYLLNAEMPTYTYLMALAYALTGGVHEWAARAVSVLFSLAALWILYLFIRRLSGERTALFALIFAAFSPMNVALARSTQCDMTMVFAGTAALYFFYRYYQTQKWSHFIWSAFLMALAVGTKIYALYLFIPVIYLAWEREKWAIFRRPRNYLYCFLVSLTLIWYFYMWRVGHTLKLAYSTFGYPPGIIQGQWGYLKLFLMPYVKLPSTVILAHILTPVGIVLFAFGIFKNTFKIYRLVWVWLFSVVFYLLVMWPTAVVHPYYLLPVIPPLAFFVAQGADRVLSNPRFTFIKRAWFWVPICALELFCLFYYYRLLYFIPKDRACIVQGGKITDSLIPKNS
ncbi:MAG: hypothetical protein AUJ72_01350, partial [Candidatus Omnitrophica bacterium CG1_02_46_14]